MQGNQFIVDPPLPVQPIPDSVPADVVLLLQKFLSILRASDVVPNPSLGVEHHIHMGGHPPVFAKARRLDPEKLDIAKAGFKRLESDSIIRHSTSPWVSPMHMVPKKGGSWQPCGNYHHLNLITTLDKYPMPNMHLVKGYHQIPVAAEDIPKTAILMPFGLFEYVFTLLGCSTLRRCFNT
jgi:hypothetical protein